ncbi:hypothetical protein SRHO_G00031990 [Serrasalmus rhombeus]
MSQRGAEIAKRYRERRDADPDRRRQYLEKERARWKKDRDTRKKKGIDELSEREKRAKRKKWREDWFCQQFDDPDVMQTRPLEKQA